MTLPRPNPAVVYCTIPDGAVLFSPTRETYFGLNETGACVWEQLSRADGSMDALCAELYDRFPDAEPEQIRRDVDELLGSLVQHGLADPC